MPVVSKCIKVRIVLTIPGRVLLVYRIEYDTKLYVQPRVLGGGSSHRKHANSSRTKHTADVTEVARVQEILVHTL